ncbi:isochorismate synthase [Mycolicibacterium sp.]|uniref:isochorismate synthase n=1 Tax=Mycolicibacterium sp. TaxID=2320850 RepID=UPI0028A64572|nr:isochorismate synthase [Mycolicibacterium sp.]
MTDPTPDSTTDSTPFVLTGPAGTLVATGIRQVYDDIAAAAQALRDGSADVVVGALPFDIRRPAALLCPLRVGHSLPAAPAGGLPSVRITETMPDPQEHRARVQSVLHQLRDPKNPLQKVVLARALGLTADQPIDPLALLHRLVDADPRATAYLADLSPAGATYTGAALVGSSPELLVARRGAEVTCQPFAGSAPRRADPQADAATGAALAASAKNRHEHQLVVDTMLAALEPLCSRLDVAAEPQLSRTAALWHLSTPIRGELREKSTTAVDLALVLHPTPAVGGVPTAAAVDLITAVEADRGFYAGAVGWCDAQGDGRWMVAIRGAQLSADRRTALAQAGGGIVAESDPDEELAETTVKFRTILSALGVSA